MESIIKSTIFITTGWVEKMSFRAQAKYLTHSLAEWCAIKDDEGLNKCAESESRVVFILYGDIITIPDIVAKIKTLDKLAFVHIDLISGLSSKEISVDFLKKYTQADGIITTKPNLIKRAKEFWTTPPPPERMAYTPWRRSIPACPTAGAPFSATATTSTIKTGAASCALPTPRRGRPSSPYKRWRTWPTPP